MRREQLIGDEMLKQNMLLHQSPGGYGGSGWKHVDEVLAFAQRLGPADTLLDYGCGEGSLYQAICASGADKWLDVREYDPALALYSATPEPADLVVCTDVLEHVELDKIHGVVEHIASLALRGCYLTMATRPGNKKLPMGCDAHLIIQQASWWRSVIELPAWHFVRETVIYKEDGTPHDYRVWLRR